MVIRLFFNFQIVKKAATGFGKGKQQCLSELKEGEFLNINVNLEKIEQNKKINKYCNCKCKNVMK